MYRLWQIYVRKCDIKPLLPAVWRIAKGKSDLEHAEILFKAGTLIATVIIGSRQ